MIEIQSFSGDAAELSAFVQTVWTERYRGTMPVPLWDPSYFEWQLLGSPSADRDYLLAAYDGSTLVGCLLAEPFRFRLHRSERTATMASWLTVHPDYQRRGIGARLAGEQRRRHVERGAAFLMGFGYFAAAESAGPRFWQSQPHTRVIGKIGFWVRVLDHEAAALWTLSRSEARLARAAGVFQRSSGFDRVELTGIRNYRADDLSDCVEAARGLLKDVDLGYVWSEQRLGHQLQFGGVPRTIVLEKGGSVRGFVNYYGLPLLGRTVIRSGVIDLAAIDALSAGDQKRILLATLGQMKQEGIALALILRLSCYPRTALIRAGFAPLPSDSYLICQLADETLSLEGVRRLHVHWR